MALMWPKRLPDWVVNDPRRKAEREVYERLSRALNDDWSVYYSRPWWGISPTGAEVDGEADFIVAHAEFGVLFLEVKGGLINYDPASTNWTSKDRNGVRHRIKDPVQQAMRSKHELLKKFQSSPTWPTRRVRLRHGVIFPDCEPRDSHFVAGYEPELFCFSAELRDGVLSWIRARLSSHDSDRDYEVGPGPSGIAAIDAMIAAPANLVVPLHRQLGSDATTQDALLTGAQLAAVTSIDAYDRVVVEGGAGTGKTLVALELAVRHARGGKKVLLCCLSEALMATLQRRAGSEPGVVIATTQVVTTAAANAKAFDVVIVDEGQDVDWHQWDGIERLVRTGGLLRVFYDSNQAIYRARADLETRLNANSYPLRLNVRNTQKVAAVTEKLYRGPLITCGGSEGRPVVGIEVPADAESAVDVVRELVQEQHLAPGDVAVLTSNPRGADEVRAALASVGFKVTDATSWAPGSVVVSSIAEFKGLEALAVVVLADRLTANRDELAYVAVSRARALLVVIGQIAETKLGKAIAMGREC